MARLSKLIQALLHLEKEEPDKRVVGVKVQYGDTTWDYCEIKGIEEVEDPKFGSRILLVAPLTTGRPDDNTG